MDLTDEAAIGQVRAGNTEAFRVLVERHSRAVFRLAYRMTGNQQDAEDTVQETFLRAYRQLRHFDGRAAFGTWLHRVTANCAIDLLRSRKKRDGDGDTLLDKQIAREPSPERLTASTQVSQMLNSAMDELTDTERAAFVMRHYEGLPMEEIGRLLKVQPNAAKHSVFRAVQKLRRALEPAMGAVR